MLTQTSRAWLYRFVGMAALAAVLLVPAARAAAAASPAVPPALQPALYTAMGKDAGPAYAIGKSGCATLKTQQLTACFQMGGVHLSGKNAPPVLLHLAAYGRGRHLTTVVPVKPEIVGNRASYEHGAVTEWWRVLPVGFEQGFTLAKRPAGKGDFILELTANRKAATHGDDLSFGKLGYGKLVVTDAKGHVVPATLKSDGSRIRIAVNDAHVVYPLTVDPLVWNQQKLTANDGGNGDLFGFSVAMSGSVALVGAPYAASDEGAVYVFTESNGTWTQTQQLTPSNGAPNSYFGWSMTLSGTTALIGAPAAGLGGAQGAVYVFTESNGTWSQAQELQASDGQPGDSFGFTVAIDGTTAMASAPRATVNGAYAQGAVYVFTDSNGSWSQSQELTASDGAVDDFFGNSLALLADTALVGEDNYNDQQGTAYVFTKSGGNWSQAQQLFSSDGVPNDYFGWAVALYGTTALVGAPRATVNGNSNHGAVYVYTESGGAWDQTQKLTPNDDSRGSFGSSIATGDAEAFIGAPYVQVFNHHNEGVVYQFSEHYGVWIQHSVFASFDRIQYQWFGYSIAFNGTVAIIGAANDNGYGAAYVDTGSCPQGYSETDGSLNAGGLYTSAPYQAPAGVENGILGAPGGFQFYAQYSNGGSTNTYMIPGNEIHKFSPAGIYRWLVKAGSKGGTYVLCILHP